MKFERSGGILLHPTSLPGRHGIGDIGPQAWRWVDFLARAGCRIWQTLPLGPTGFGDSPYQCLSSFAGNPLLISPEALYQDGLLSEADLTAAPAFPDEGVDYGAVISWKPALLKLAHQRFTSAGSSELSQAFASFREEHTAWLDDYALFMALKEAHGGAPWVEWEAGLRRREPQAMRKARKDLAAAIEEQAFAQFLFERQWQKLRARAREAGVTLIGDLPIFVAQDSCDVWAHPELFHLEANGKPSVVSGVPPDYFSPTGQLWGNPLYRWETHARDGYRWWAQRIQAALRWVDLVRLDHFRGFAACWEVPASAPTAEHGRWVSGPGKRFLQAMRTALGDLPLIAEDLGVITTDVVAMREAFRLPGMRVLQFGFSGDPHDPFLPHNYPDLCVAYTGTHDNDTARGWYGRVAEAERSFYRRYLNREGSEVAWDMLRAVWASVAVYAIAPMQDVLNLDNSARMNYPGNPSGNWRWRMREEAMNEALCEKLRELNFLYGRLPPPPSPNDR